MKKISKSEVFFENLRNKGKTEILQIASPEFNNLMHQVKTDEMHKSHYSELGSKKVILRC